MTIVYYNWYDYIELYQTAGGGVCYRTACVFDYMDEKFLDRIEPLPMHTVVEGNPTGRDWVKEMYNK